MRYSLLLLIALLPAWLNGASNSDCKLEYEPDYWWGRVRSSQIPHEKMFDAVVAGDTSELSRLLDKGIPLDITTETGMTVAECALFLGDERLLAMLFDRGALLSGEAVLQQYYAQCSRELICRELSRQDIKTTEIIKRGDISIVQELAKKQIKEGVRYSLLYPWEFFDLITSNTTLAPLQKKNIVAAFYPGRDELVDDLDERRYDILDLYAAIMSGAGDALPAKKIDTMSVLSYSNSIDTLSMLLDRHVDPAKARSEFTPLSYRRGFFSPVSSFNWRVVELFLNKAPGTVAPQLCAADSLFMAYCNNNEKMLNTVLKKHGGTKFLCHARSAGQHTVLFYAVDMQRYTDVEKFSMLAFDSLLYTKALHLSVMIKDTTSIRLLLRGKGRPKKYSDSDLFGLFIQPMRAMVSVAKTADVNDTVLTKIIEAGLSAKKVSPPVDKLFGVYKDQPDLFYYYLPTLNSDSVTSYIQHENSWEFIMDPKIRPRVNTPKNVSEVIVSCVDNWIRKPHLAIVEKNKTYAHKYKLLPNGKNELECICNGLLYLNDSCGLPVAQVFIDSHTLCTPKYRIRYNQTAHTFEPLFVVPSINAKAGDFLKDVTKTIYSYY